MCDIRVIDSQTLFEKEYDNKIIAFDKKNMKEILGAAEITFPEEKRRKGFESKPVIIAAFDRKNELVGYLEYCRSWNSKDDIFISSLQIDKNHRNGFLLMRLLSKARETLLNQDFDQIICGVHKNNLVAIKIYRKLGFVFMPNPENEKSLTGSLNKRALNEKSVVTEFINRKRTECCTE